MKRIYYIIALTFVIAVGSITACKEEFLEIAPNGGLDAQVMATKDGVDGLLIGAYSMLDGVSSNVAGWEAASSYWVFGSIRGMEANKSTDSGDQPDINPLQNYSESATNPYLNAKWRSAYDAVARCNSVILVATTALENGAISNEDYDSFIRQARTLRGWYHFEAYRMWAKSDGTGIPYVDETTDPFTVTNDVDIREKILTDMDQGRTLPNNMGQVGRFNGTVAKVLWAKAQMQMNGTAGYTAALPVLVEVAASGTNPTGQKAGLEAKYGDVFDIEFRNGKESIYTIQYSVNDGSGGWNAGWGEVLNFPYKSGGGSPGGCCGFFQPTQEFVNSFRVDANGLPFLDNSYNNNPVKNDQGLNPTDPFTPDAGTFDPRLDWSVGRRGITYLDWGPHTGKDWIRDQTYAGPWSPKKQVYKKSQEGSYTEVGNWTSGWTANGYRMIRYADVLLLIAECEAILGQDDLGRGEVNQVRARAANPESWVKNPDNSNAANYVIGLYNTAWAQADAFKAIQMERKLELGMEGHRYFDLQRWGNVVTELTRIYNYEKTNAWGSQLYNQWGLGNEDVNYPIPQRQLDLMNGALTQNR
jgi:hypothetical protein